MTQPVLETQPASSLSAIASFSDHASRLTIALNVLPDAQSFKPERQD